MQQGWLCTVIMAIVALVLFHCCSLSFHCLDHLVNRLLGWVSLFCLIQWTLWLHLKSTENMRKMVMGKSKGQANRGRREDVARIGTDRKKKPLGTVRIQCSG